MDDKIFFALVKVQGVDIYGGFGASGADAPFEIHLVNNSDSPIAIRKLASGGFKTYDSDLVVMDKPKDKDVNIRIEANGYVRYAVLYIDDFDGAKQYETHIEIDGTIKKFEFTLSRGVGLLDTKIPCLNQFGRIMRSRITEA